MCHNMQYMYHMCVYNYVFDVCKGLYCVVLLWSCIYRKDYQIGVSQQNIFLKGL